VAKNKKSKDNNPPKLKAVRAAKPSAKTQEQAAAEKQALAMWALLGVGGAAYGGRLNPEIAKTERAALVQMGLIESEKRERGALWLTATDRGWDWAEQHLADPLPDKTFGGAHVLRTWLERLQAFLRARDVRLAEVLATQPEPSPAKPDVAKALDHAELRERIRAAYLDVAGGFNRRALLSDLRARLPEIDRSVMDVALKRLQRDDEASLMQLDNRMDVTDADRGAALQIGNEPRHIIWISK
jgi:hypothetical protein